MDEEVQCPHLFVRGATGSSVSSCRRLAGHGRGGGAIAPVCDRYPRNWLEKEHLTAVGILTATIVPGDSPSADHRGDVVGPPRQNLPQPAQQRLVFCTQVFMNCHEPWASYLP